MNATDQSVRLDSCGEVGAWNRWSYAPGPAMLSLRCDSATHLTTLRSASGSIQSWDDPLAALRWMEKFHRRPIAPGPPFKGGWIGYLSYDLARLFEDLPIRSIDDLKLPLFEFTYHDRGIVIDRANERRIEFTAPIPDHRAPLRFDNTMELSNRPAAGNFTRDSYERAAARAIDYIAAGDVFQVNLSQRFSFPLKNSPGEIYEQLQRDAGSTYGAFLNYGDHALLCNSPELFLRVTPDPITGQRRVITRPIKGTRPRGEGMEDALLRSRKDQAELNMIVDLERNDLGRVCEIGSVRVTQPREIESHPTVYHGVATIEGDLREDIGLVDLLRATFPGGSVTGAPKIRAMQIIDELEPARRGPYCGAIGFISNDGHIEFNIAIRTMIATGGQIHVPVGGGIVADSDPAEEYEETLVKAAAMLRALGVDVPNHKQQIPGNSKE